MQTLDQTLAQRVDETFAAHSQEKLLSTTGTRSAVEELARRNEGLEMIVRELALEVQRLSETVAGLSEPAGRYTVSIPVSEP